MDRFAHNLNETFSLNFKHRAVHFCRFFFCCSIWSQLFLRVVCSKDFQSCSVRQALNYQDVDTHVILLVTSRQVFHQKCQYSIIGLLSIHNPYRKEENDWVPPTKCINAKREHDGTMYIHSFYVRCYESRKMKTKESKSRYIISIGVQRGGIRLHPSWRTKLHP